MNAPAGGGVERISGDGQRGRPGDILGKPLIIRIVAADGTPRPNVVVAWTATTGTIAPPIVRTDSLGFARATWILGARGGAYRAWARAEGRGPVTFTALVDPTTPNEPVALTAVTLHTYEGSGQAVHPDQALVDPGSPLTTAATRWLGVTPYPYGDAKRENPSVFSGDAPEAWSLLEYATNPVAMPAAGAYLSDPDLVYVPDLEQIWLYYREVTGENRILLTRTSDGRSWSAPQMVARAASHMIVSPAIVRRSPTEWLMWSVNSGSIGCSASSTTVEVRRSSDGVVWSQPKPVRLNIPDRWAWHIDVNWIPELAEYWALIAAKTPGSCTTAELLLATSADGEIWHTYPAPVLRRGALVEFSDIVYRSTLSYDAESDLVSLWYSGARYVSSQYEWRVAYERRRRADLFADISNRLGAAALGDSRGPPLTNKTAP